MALEIRRSSLRLRATVLVVLAVVISVLAVDVSSGPSAEAATNVTLPLTTFRDVERSADGRIVVAGDDRVLVYSALGQLITIVPDVFGAADIDVRDGHAYVLQTTAGAVADIDLATYARSDITIGTTVNAGGIAVLPDAIWFLTTGVRAARFDRTTAAVTVPTSTTASGTGRLLRVPGDDSRVVTAQSSSGWVEVVQAATPHAVVKYTGTLPHTGALAPTDRGTLVASAGAGGGIRELDLDDLAWATPVRPSPDTTQAQFISWTPGAGGTVAWGGNRTSFVGDDTSTTQSHIHALSVPSSTCLRGLALDEAATTLVHVVADNCSTGQPRLIIESLAPQVATVVPGSAVEGVGSTVTVTGNGLGEPGSVTLGGLPVAPTSVTPTQLVFSVPDGLAAGVHDLVVTSVFGTASRTFQIAPNVGALLRGTVRRSSAAVSGATVTLEGSAIPSPLVMTTGSDGAYAFPTLPLGSDYVVTVTDPSGSQTPQTVSALAITPNDTTVLDISLVDRPGSASAHAAVPATPTDLVLESTTGRSFLAAGEEIVVTDPTGAVIHRRRGMPGVASLTTMAGAVYALAPSTGSIVRIDAATLAQTGAWTLPTAVYPTIAAAGGRLWVLGSTGTDTYLALDAASGFVTTYPASYSTPRLSAVVGDTNVLLLNDGTNSGTVRVVDVGGGSPATVASRSGSLPAHGDAVFNRVFLPSGEELRLSDLSPTGVTYPATSGQSSFQSSGMGVSGVSAKGGVVVFGRNLVQRGTPRLTHVLATPSILRPVLDDGATRVVSASSTTISSYTLSPALSGPATAFAEPQTFAVSGFGLGAATSARVDGNAVVIGARAAASLELQLPALDPGPHTVDVTTPWGTTAPLAVTAVTRTPTPTLTSVTPATLPTAGGTVTISGSGFTGATEVKIGSPVVVLAASFTVVDDATIVATFGPKTAMTGVLSVTTAGGGSSASGPALAFVAPQPMVSGLDPAVGPSTGGTVVTVTGSGFQFASAVKFGSTPGTSVTVVSDSELRVTSPPGTVGSYDVKVTTAGGTSAGTPGAVFTYELGAPTVTKVSPSSGPSAGGTLVTLTGTNFATVQRVQFGETEAAYVVADATRIVAVAPPGSGVVNVRVTTTAGSSTATTSNRFTYLAPEPGSVRGVVRNSAGALPGMAVVLSRPDRFEVLTYVLSGADGSFDIPAVTPGEYRVLTLDPGSLIGASSYHLPELYDDGGSLLDDVAAATPVVVSEGVPTVLDPIVLAHSDPGTISGVVRDAAGHELAGMEVVVSPAAAFDSSVSVLTGADGRFAVPGLAPGSYRIVTLDPAESGGATAHYVTEVYDDAGGLGAFGSSTAVPLAAGGSVELAPIVLAHTAPGSLTATVTSTSGVPLQHMLVFVANADGDGFGGANVTAANGTVTVGNLPPGEYRVGIFDARLLFGVPPLWAHEFYDGAATFEASEVVVVAAGAATPLGTVTLAPFVP